MKKQAFLILASNLGEQVIKLIKNLAIEENFDIFIHVDKKIGSINKSTFKKFKNVFFIDRIRTDWASFSLVEAELKLLRKAVMTNDYSYVHLLSGSDLPLKSNSEIIEFFKNETHQFVDFEEINTYKVMKRIDYYYPLQKFAGKKRGIVWFLQKIGVVGQKVLNINRTRKLQNINFAKGSQWFSITGEFANFILKDSLGVINVLKHGQTVDELLVQTVLLNSPFIKDISNPNYGNLRFIKWKERDVNSPEILTIKDLNELKNTNKLFARKFDETVDEKIVESILKERKKQ
jgi:hypothetical protein